MNSKRYFDLVIAIAMFSSIAHLSSAQESSEPLEVSYPESYSEPMGLYSDILGDFTYPISSQNSEAQAYFDQGFRLMYAFAQMDSVRSFRAAQLADPNCAICYWGESWSWGSYLNGPMTTANAPRAYIALQRALALIDQASSKEADLIHALSRRYVKEYKPEERRKQDEAYRDAMEALVEKYPQDLNIATLYADALFLLEQRRGYRHLDDPNTAHLLHSLESVLNRDLSHPGACHLYIHATEATPTPELAAPCAQLLGDSIPGASHINHMPSHTWNEMGLWQEAIDANTRAWHSDQKAAFDEGFAIYPTHNLHMLFYAASMGGQGAIAIQAAKDLAKLNRDPTMHAQALLRFGRFDELLEIKGRPTAEVNAGIFDFTQGYAALKAGDLDTAKNTLVSLLELADTTKARYRFHDGKNILHAAAGILQGEMAWLEGNLEAAIDAFKRGAEYYDAIDYDEPEPLAYSPRHWLGAAYIEAGAFDLAIAEYQQDLKEHPNNGWALLGIQQALAAKGETDPEIDAALEKAWARSDTWVRSSKF